MSNRLIITAAPYPLSPPPFEGMDSWAGATMPDPVDPPEPGIQDLPVRELAAYAGTLRDVDNGSVYADARPRALRLESGATPPAVKPPGVDTRPRRHPLTNWPEQREVIDWNPHGVHSHGQLTPGVSAQAQGNQQPGIVLRRNTFRLSPEPWDSVQMLERPSA